MKRAFAAILGGTAGVGALLVVVWLNRTPGAEPPPAPTAQRSPADTEAPESPPRRSVLAEVRPLASAKADAGRRAPRKRSRFAMQIAEEPALSGLGVETLNSADRQRLKVPDRFGSGVLITSVHPDSPAAEAGLVPGDVIVRAMRENVNNPEDLKRVVGKRGHTVLIGAREGALMELVIQKPYEAD